MIENCFLFYKRLFAKIHTIFVSPLFYAIGKKTSVQPPFRFKNLSQIQLGSKCTIHRNCWMQVVGAKHNNSEPAIIIGDCVSLGMDSTVSATKKIIIKDHVFTARNVYISDHEHEYRDISRPIGEQGIANIAEVKIGAETWIGQNAAILPGVTIGRHCIIGANSVVNCDIPDYSIAVGVPAKVIRFYNPEKRCWEKVKIE